MVKTGESAERDAQSYAVLSMANHRLQHAEAAREALANSTELVEVKLRKRDAGDREGSWNEWIIAQTLLREAKELIGGKAPVQTIKP